MNERPILFNGDMVRAILAGRKTQTRRVVKPQPEMVTNRSRGHRHIAPWQGDPAYLQQLLERNKRGCPYGNTGDRLWVRESFWQAGDQVFTYPEDDEGTWSGSRRVHFAADGNPPNEPNRHYPDGLRNGSFSAAEPNRLWRKRPSIHMPRWASRITLEIVSVRVERLQDISEMDAIAEGCDGGHAAISGYGYSASPFEHFRHVWQKIKGFDSWDGNPWVWVVEFKQI